MARFPEALDVIASDPAIDSILVQNGPMSQQAFELADAIAASRDRMDKTVCLAWPLPPKGAAERSRAHGFHVFGEYARAINAIAKATRYRSDLSRPDAEAPPVPLAFDWTKHVPQPRAGQVISEHACHAILRAAGLRVAAGELAESEEGAAEAARRVGFPLVMKGISPKVTHRAKAGLVAVDIRSEEDVRATFGRLRDRGMDAGTPLDGVYLQRMAEKGREVLVSGFVDPVFGPMLSCGAGGVLTELLEDVVLARAPVSEERATDLLRTLRIAREPNADIAPLAAFASHFSRLVAAAPWRAFTLEVNPVIWNEAGALAVDGLLIVEDP
jgi:acyl-CoA synthetase (NDP forming)